MITNDILKRVRFALDIDDTSMLKMVEAGGKSLEMDQLQSYFLGEDDLNYKICSTSVLLAFLDGLIISKRGPRKEGLPAQDGAGKSNSPINNLVMKKLRIALELRESDLVEIFKMVDYRVSGSEINALFRRPDHKNFRECGDQMLRNFLQGLVKKYRNIK